MNGLFDKNETNNQPSSIEPKGDDDVIADGEDKHHHTHLLAKFMDFGR
jgi:hypothetical protein